MTEGQEITIRIHKSSAVPNQLAGVVTLDGKHLFMVKGHTVESVLNEVYNRAFKDQVAIAPNWMTKYHG